MPLKWVEPERYVRIDDRREIYHVYKDNDIERVLEYYYTTSPCEDDAFQFDIRDLPAYASAKRPGNHRAILKRAAARGEIKFPD